MYLFDCLSQSCWMFCKFVGLIIEAKQKNVAKFTEEIVFLPCILSNNIYMLNYFESKSVGTKIVTFVQEGSVIMRLPCLFPIWRFLLVWLKFYNKLVLGRVQKINW